MFSFWRKRQSQIIHLKTTKYANYAVAGTAHHQDALCAIFASRHDQDDAVAHCQAKLRAEPENTFDQYAIRVEVAGRTVGYLRKGDARKVHDLCGGDIIPKLPQTFDCVIVDGRDELLAKVNLTKAIQRP